MARYVGPVCRLCRREGEKLFLKGDRCYSAKCAVERREGSPGQHARHRGRFSEFKVQLREKQKVKRIYGLLERQFRNLFRKADQMKGVTGTNLLVSLERRLDNIVYRAGFTSSRREGRHYVSHGHFMVNGRRVNIPSSMVYSGDIVTVADKSRSNMRITASLANLGTRSVPEWLELDKDNFKVSVRDMPTREQLPPTLNEQLIVELYSK